jgi:hypothetical protein
MPFPHVDSQSLGKLQEIILMIEGIILNIILFVQMCIKHFRK